MALSLIGLKCDILQRTGCMEQTFLGQKLAQCSSVVSVGVAIRNRENFTPLRRK